MVCTRKTKTLVSTCVILSGMTNIICLLYVGWVTNYIASVYVRGQEPAPDKKLEEDKGDTLKIIERLDHLENVIKQHIQGTGALGNLSHEHSQGVPSDLLVGWDALRPMRIRPVTAGRDLGWQLCGWRDCKD
ncbi:Putative polypeptide N-acetylgalactosaminyltransferase-like protein 4 [Cricetulus griseus]|uniref:Putative polypeptide N-acetylgalactosaminyltransferase-like protein 4 n=1 Tax=Cricetulus griseus TaxID=10029 RepID=G3HWE5_CRIGR|nr:Putative polypeptide N-acetylgalactosaminyltransferase-like protein 4 [Cricetulus griseus]ERE80116.1 putative polypeptide N-acetylgalactosaminyltransferase-like protein 4 [Cricetulus griseus]